MVEAEAIARTVQSCGGIVEIACTVAQASTFAGSIDTLLVDAALERGDGRVLKRLRAAGFAAAKAVTLIAPTDRGMLGRFRASGYSTFLARPVRGDTLIRVLSSPANVGASVPAQGPQASKAQISGDVGRRSMSVLIAEDNDINALLAQVTLNKSGHRVDVVGNGRAAVDALTEAGGHTL